MNLDGIKDFFNKLSAHDLLTGGIVLAGILLLILVIKAAKLFFKLAIFVGAVALFAGAYWWHSHR